MSEENKRQDEFQEEQTIEDSTPEEVSEEAAEEPTEESSPAEDALEPEAPEEPNVEVETETEAEAEETPEPLVSEPPVLEEGWETEGGEPSYPPVPPVVPEESFPSEPPAFSDTPDAASYHQVDTAAAPSKKAPVVPIAIGIAAVLFLVGIYLVFVKGIFRNPKKALTTAISSTSENISNGPELAPKIELDLLQPRKTTLEASLAQSGDFFFFLPDYVRSMKFNMDYRNDLKGKQSYFAFGLETSLYSIYNTEFYVTPEEMLMRIPNLYDEHDFVRVDFEKFPQDWNNSDYGADQPVNPSLDIPSAINSYYDLSTQMIENYQNREEVIPLEEVLMDAVKKLEEPMEVEKLSDTKEHDIYQVTIQPEDFSSFMQEVGTAMKDYNYETYKQFVEIIPAEFLYAMDITPAELLEELAYSSEEVGNILRSLKIEKPAVILVHVSKKTHRVSEVRIDPMTVSYYDSYYEETYDETFALELYFADTTYAMDKMTLNFHSYLYDFTAENPEIPSWAEGVEDAGKETFTFVHLYPEEENLVGSRWEMIFDVGYSDYPELVTMYADYSWDPEEASENNIAFRFGMESDDRSDSASLLLTGRLDVDGPNIHFTNGRLGMLQGHTEALGFLINVESVEINASELAPTPKNTVDFFQVEWEKHLEALMTELETLSDTLYY